MKVNFTESIKRIMEIEKLDHEYQVAELFDLKASDLAKRKKSGTILPFLVEWGLNHKVNLHWLLTGEGKSLEGKDDLLPLNSALLREVIEVVELVLGKHVLVLEPHDKAEVVTVLYEMYLDSGKKPEERTTERMLRLVA